MPTPTVAMALEALNILADASRRQWGSEHPGFAVLRAFIESSGADAERWHTLRDSLPPINRTCTGMPMIMVPCAIGQGYTVDGFVAAIDAARSLPPQKKG